MTLVQFDMLPRLSSCKLIKTDCGRSPNDRYRAPQLNCRNSIYIHIWVTSWLQCQLTSARTVFFKKFYCDSSKIMAFLHQRGNRGRNARVVPYPRDYAQRYSLYPAARNAHCGAIRQPSPLSVMPLMTVDTQRIIGRIACHPAAPTNFNGDSSRTSLNNRYSTLQPSQSIGAHCGGSVLLVLCLRGASGAPHVTGLLPRGGSCQAPGLNARCIQGQKHTVSLATSEYSVELQSYSPTPPEPIISDDALMDLLLNLQEPPANLPAILEDPPTPVQDKLPLITMDN